MKFEVNVPTPKQQPSGYMRANLGMLAKMLHLPEGITITAVRPDPNDAHGCILELGGPKLPKGTGGEWAPNYVYEHATIVKLRSLDNVGGSDGQG